MALVWDLGESHEIWYSSFTIKLLCRKCMHRQKKWGFMNSVVIDLMNDLDVEASIV